MNIFLLVFILKQSTGAGERVKPAPKSINKQRSPTPKWVQVQNTFCYVFFQLTK